MSRQIKTYIFPVAIFFLLSFYSCYPVFYQTNLNHNLKNGSVNFVSVKSDTLFGSKQDINLLIVPKKALGKYSIALGFCNQGLMGTSLIAANNKALAGINGGFFDRDKGGDVRYLEINGSTICRTRADGTNWSKPDSVANGALIFYGTYNIKIENAKSDLFYENSKSESAVLIAGPMLIKDSKPQKLPNLNITSARHPRTCLGITSNSVILVTIDGRNENAAGMTLYETQKFLAGIKCTDAINLDGGGSTTMWIKDKGIVNHPSDPEGERPVSDAILIKKRLSTGK